MSVTFEVISDGTRPLVVKRAQGSDAARLRAEGARLRAASHPGVVQVLSSGPAGEGWELRMVHAGRPLEIMSEMSPTQVAAVAASLATTVADLHASGIVHGRVDPTHVLLGPHGRPVLCGFAAGDAAGAGAARPVDDVAAIGSLMVGLLGTEGEAEPIPERRWRRRGHWTGWERRALLTIADQACAEPAARRPTARRLAAAISAAVPAAAMPLQAAGSNGGLDSAPNAPSSAPDPLDVLRATATEPSTRRGPRPLAVALAALGVAALVVGFHRSRAEPDAAPDPSTAASRTTAPPEGSPLALPTTALPIAPTGCGPVGGVDVDGDGCREPVQVDGRTIEVGPVTFVVGVEGDEVAVGDWNCDGEPTPAVLRPTTGEVFVFAHWDPVADVVVEPVATVAGGTELVVAPSSEACSGLGVRTADTIVEIVRSPT